MIKILYTFTKILFIYSKNEIWLWMEEVRSNYPKRDNPDTEKQTVNVFPHNWVLVFMF